MEKLGASIRLPDAPKVEIPKRICACGADVDHNSWDKLCRACIVENNAANELRRKFNEAGLSPRHAKRLTWESLIGDDKYVASVQKLRDKLAASDTVIGIIGPRGTGKTQAATVAVWQAIIAGKSAKLVTAANLYCDQKARFADKSGDGEMEWERDWGRPLLLVIDEISELRQDEYAKSRLTALVDRRYRDTGKPTVIVGNVTIAAWASCVGDSIASRANENGGVFVFDGWPSFRG